MRKTYYALLRYIDNKLIPFIMVSNNMMKLLWSFVFQGVLVVLFSLRLYAKN